MADADSIKQLEARLTRLEATLAQQPGGATTGFTPPGGSISDPAPFPGGGYGYPRWPHPITDPGPWWGGWGHQYWPHPIVDPAPHPIVDPAVFAGGIQARSAAASLGRIGHIGGDPPPPDVSRFSIAQLEASLHSINAEK